MKTRYNSLLVNQLDQKFKESIALQNIDVPPKGWIHAIRTTLKMSLQQLGNRLGISAQSVKEIEQREVKSSLTIRALKEVANALDMKVIYVLLPKDESLAKMIEKRANEIARQIVMRTSNSMKLEDQEVSYERIEKAILEKTEELKSKMPKYLWD